MNILVGKTLTAIHLAEDKEALKFDVEGGESVVARCAADCCSYTWVEHITLPALGFPCKVLRADDVDMPDLGDVPGMDCVQYYGFKIETDKGDILIDYRNESNGYYGGSLSWPGQRFYGGVYKQNVPNEAWQPVTQDV